MSFSNLSFGARARSFAKACNYYQNTGDDNPESEGCENGDDEADVPEIEFIPPEMMHWQPGEEDAASEAPSQGGVDSEPGEEEPDIGDFPEAASSLEIFCLFS